METSRLSRDGLARKFLVVRNIAAARLTRSCRDRSNNGVTFGERSRICGIFICACHFKRAEEYNMCARARTRKHSRSCAPFYLYPTNDKGSPALLLRGTTTTLRTSPIFNGRQRPFRGAEELCHRCAGNCDEKRAIPLHSLREKRKKPVVSL